MAGAPHEGSRATWQDSSRAGSLHSLRTAQRCGAERCESLLELKKRGAMCVTPPSPSLVSPAPRTPRAASAGRRSAALHVNSHSPTGSRIVVPARERCSPSVCVGASLSKPEVSQSRLVSVIPPLPLGRDVGHRGHLSSSSAIAIKWTRKSWWAGWRSSTLT